MRLLLCTLVFIVSFTCSGQLIPFRINKQWGYCDTNRVIKIKAQFDFADFFNNNLAFVKKDSLFYGINKAGNIVTPAIKHYGTVVILEKLQ